MKYYEPTLFAILDLDNENADDATIKEAYRMAIKACHPDVK